MSIYNQRDIILVPFPYTDLTSQKVRPALVISNDQYNLRSKDILVCGITSKVKNLPYSVVFELDDIEEPGTLRTAGRIKVDAIVTLEQSIIIKRIARINLDLFRQVIAEIRNLIKV